MEDGERQRMPASESYRAARRVFTAMFAFSALIVALHLFNAAFIDGTLFNFSVDWTVPSFASAAVFAVAALICRRAAAHDEARATWLMLAVLMAVFSAESLLNLHGRAEEVEGMRTVALVLEPLLGLVVLVALAGRVRRLARPAPILLAAALAVFVVAEIDAVEISVVAVTGALRGVAIVVEEWGEMLVACLVAAAAAGAAVPLQRRSEAVPLPAEPAPVTSS